MILLEIAANQDVCWNKVRVDIFWGSLAKFSRSALP
jgi:hypothetical protein